MIYVIDTETNGAKVPEVIELGWLQLDNPEINGRARFRPSVPSGCGALSVHHILNEELELCPPSTTAQLPEDCTAIIGHNVDYDWAALGRPTVKRICTLVISRHISPELESHTLGAMMYAYLPPEEARKLLKNAHTAFADAYACYRLLLKLVFDPKILLDEDALWKYSESCRRPTHMPFGKHKGEPLRKVPRSYIRWLLQQPEVDPYLMAAIKELS